jgi:hypothetical protein
VLSEWCSLGAVNQPWNSGPKDRLMQKAYSGELQWPLRHCRLQPWKAPSLGRQPWMSPSIGQQPWKYGNGSCT